MPGVGETSKRKLLNAAAEEFATYGIAGARTGRIARTAGVNESLLFRHFGNKDSLFESVYSSLVEGTTDSVPIDVLALPAYAGALFDYYLQHQTVLRLSVWAALERPDLATTDSVTTATRNKIAAIEAAQRSGAVSTQLTASELLAVVIQLSLSGAKVSPALGIDVDTDTRRASIITAVAAITDPKPR